MRPLLIGAVIALAGIAGCVDQDPRTQDTEEWAAPLEGSAFRAAPDAAIPVGTPEGHADTPAREESEVEGGGVPLGFSSYARKTVTISNGLGGASLAFVNLGVQEGTVRVETVPGDEYKLVAVLEANAQTEQTARQALDRITLTHEDEMRPDGLHLTTGIRYDPGQQMVPFLDGLFFAYAVSDVTLQLPAAAAYDLWVTSQWGDVSAVDVRGPRVRLQADGGLASLERINAVAAEGAGSAIEFDSVAARTGLAEDCGRVQGVALHVDSFEAQCSEVDLEGFFGDVDLNATRGDLRLVAEPTRTGTFALWAQGTITAAMAILEGVAYDVDAQSEEGSVTIELPDVTLAGSEEAGHKTARSATYDAAEVQTMLQAYAMEGDVTVQDVGAYMADQEEPEEP